MADHDDRDGSEDDTDGRSGDDSVLDMVVWRFGDPWRDLRPDELAAGEVAIVTAHRSVTQINAREGWTQPRATRGNLFSTDDLPLVLEHVAVATPCGFHVQRDIRHLGHRTTPLLVAMRGTDAVLRHPAVREAVRGHRWPDGRPEGHPPEPCGALYCPMTRIT